MAKPEFSIPDDVPPTHKQFKAWWWSQHPRIKVPLVREEVEAVFEKDKELEREFNEAVAEILSRRVQGKAVGPGANG